MVSAALFGTNLAQCHSVSWLPGRVFSVTQVSMSPVPLFPELSSSPPLRVGTSIHPALVCISLGNPGGLGSSYLTFRDRNILWSVVSLRALSCGLPFFHVAASDVQLQMPFSKSLPAAPGSLARKLACPRLQPLTYNRLPAIVHWLANLRVQRKPSLWLFSAGGNRRAASHAYKDLANNSHLWVLEPWILVL